MYGMEGELDALRWLSMGGDTLTEKDKAQLIKLGFMNPKTMRITDAGSLELTRREEAAYEPVNTIS